MLNKESQWQSGGSGTDRESETTQLVHSRNPQKIGQSLHPDVTMDLPEIRSQAQVRENWSSSKPGCPPPLPRGPTVERF